MGSHCRTPAPLFSRPRRGCGSGRNCHDLFCAMRPRQETKNGYRARFILRCFTLVNRLFWLEVVMVTRLVGITWASWFACLSVLPALAQSPSFNCGRARLPDEIAICRTPELAEYDNIIAAAYAYLKLARGTVYADQVGIPFWRLRQGCQYDVGCIRQVQIQAINAYQAAGAVISLPQHTSMAALEDTVPQNDHSVELRLCRN